MRWIVQLKLLTRRKARSVCLFLQLFPIPLMKAQLADSNGEARLSEVRTIEWWWKLLRVRRRKRFAICAPHFLSWAQKPSEKFHFSPVLSRAKERVLPAPIIRSHWPNRAIAYS